MLAVVDRGFSEDKVAIGFVNSEGEVEYDLYQKIDGGVIDSAHETDSSLAAVMASEAGITEYDDYIMNEIKEEPIKLGECVCKGFYTPTHCPIHGLGK